MSLQFRCADRTDIDFMKKMLYEAVFWRPNPTKPTFEEGIALNGVKDAIVEWGRKGDIAIIALIDEKQVGAAWFREYSEASKIRGFINDQIPVLVVAVNKDYRRQGIAKRMTERLIQYYQGTNTHKLSLCVSKDNPAYQLYIQLGFMDFQDIGDSVIMTYTIEH